MRPINPLTVALYVIVATVFAVLFYEVPSGWSIGSTISFIMFWAGMAAGVTLLIVLIVNMADSTRLKLAVLLATSYRIVRLRVEDGKDGFINRYVLERRVAIPYGWGQWKRVEEVSISELAAQQRLNNAMEQLSGQIVGCRAKLGIGTRMVIAEGFADGKIVDRTAMTHATVVGRSPAIVATSNSKGGTDLGNKPAVKKRTEEEKSKTITKRGQWSAEQLFDK